MSSKVVRRCGRGASIGTRTGMSRNGTHTPYRTPATKAERRAHIHHDFTYQINQRSSCWVTAWDTDLHRSTGPYQYVVFNQKLVRRIRECTERGNTRKHARKSSSKSRSTCCCLCFVRWCCVFVSQYTSKRADQTLNWLSECRII